MDRTLQAQVLGPNGRWERLRAKRWGRAIAPERSSVSVRGLVACHRRSEVDVAVDPSGYDAGKVVRREPVAEVGRENQCLRSIVPAKDRRLLGEHIQRWTSQPENRRVDLPSERRVSNATGPYRSSSSTRWIAAGRISFSSAVRTARSLPGSANTGLLLRRKSPARLMIASGPTSWKLSAR